jgi:hypothetical protein
MISCATSTATLKAKIIENVAQSNGMADVMTVTETYAKVNENVELPQEKSHE